MDHFSESTRAKRILQTTIEHGELSLGQAVRQMREITGMNQKDYARKIIGISPRILAEVKRDAVNPRLDTLNKIGRPFGYQVGFVPKKIMFREAPVFFSSSFSGT